MGVLVEFEGDDATAARAAAMQVAALKARYVSRDEVPADLLQSERRIAEATAGRSVPANLALAEHNATVAAEIALAIAAAHR